jgi:transcriptional regulator with XRE-family HTH domain
VEELASLAGMESSEWLAVEAGRVPQSAAQLRLMAAALQFSKVQLATIIQICQVAWRA